MPSIAGLLIELIILVVLFGVLDMLILQMIRKNYKWLTIITAGMAYLAVIFLGTYLFFRYMGVDMITSMAADFRSSIESAIKTAKDNGADERQLALFRQQAEFMLIRTLPAWWVITAMFLVLLNYMVTRLYAIKKHAIRNEVPPFEMWYLSEPVMWMFIVSLALFAFNKLIPYEWVTTLGLNGAFVLGNMYFLIGLSVITFLFKKFKVPGIAQTIIIILVIFWVFLSLIIVLLGILDTWFNFRKIEKGGSIWR